MVNPTEGVFADDPSQEPPLAVSSYTLGTDIPYEDRVRAAAAAGFDGFGLRAENYWDAQAAGLTDSDMVSIAADHGIDILEVEYLTAWGTADDRDATQQEKEQTVFHMARTFGVSHVNTGLLEKLPVDVMTGAYAALCERAGADLNVALEFMPYSGVPDLATAWHIVRDSGASNSALIVDAWHWARAGMSAADLADVPADKIVAIQLCDVQEHPMDPPRTESLGYRLPPGDGHGRVTELLNVLRDKRIRPRVIAAEVISHELISRGVDVAARTVADAARRVLLRGPAQIGQRRT